MGLHQHKLPFEHHSIASLNLCCAMLQLDIWCGNSTNFYLRSVHFFIFTSWSAGIAKFTRWQVLYFLLTYARSGLQTGIGWSVCISKYRQFHVSRFLGQILVCVHTIYQCSQIVIPCTILNGSLFLPSCV